MKKKRLKYIALVSALFFGTLLTSSSDAADVKAGEKVYKRKCAICHGEQGKGGNALKLNDPKVLDKKDEALRKVILEGGAGMPGYQNSLKPEEIDSLIILLRSWGGK